MADEQRSALVRGARRGRNKKRLGLALFASVPALLALIWVTNAGAAGAVWFLYAIAATPGGLGLALSGWREEGESQRLLVAYEGGHLLPPARVIER